MNRLSTVLAVIISVILVLALHFGWLYYKEEGIPASRRVEVKVAPGASLGGVQAILMEKGLLSRPRVFRIAAAVTGRDRKIKAGRYLFRRGESVSSILSKLARGEVDFERVVIPEGLMVREIASILQDRAEIDSTAFVELAGDSTYIADLGIPGPSLEGYLFPDTYLFSWPLTPREAVERMVNRFFQVYDDEMRRLADTLGFSANEVVTMASIIQAEAQFRSEMSRISAVYHNRLRKRWRLEADPTVAYALGGVRRKLSYKDLRIDSPYNTYRRRGLPPGPICSPGRMALLAAVKPVEGNRDLYFVADGTGRHLFTRTLREHLEAKRIIKYRRYAAGAPDAVEAGTVPDRPEAETGAGASPGSPEPGSPGGEQKSKKELPGAKESAAPTDGVPGGGSEPGGEPPAEKEPESGPPDDRGGTDGGG